MIKFFLIGSLVFPCLAYANATSDALRSRELAMQAMQGFNPGSILDNYSTNPVQAQLSQEEGTNILPGLGLSALSEQEAANEVYLNAKQRVRVKPDPNSPELKYAESLLENPEEVLKTGIGCADGSCDKSSDEVSQDINEGVTQLGTLGGVAGDVSSNQVDTGIPGIFKGNYMECKKYPLGFRDCCTDAGWGDWIKHCPQQMQVILKARHENRAVFTGSYREKRWKAKHFGYCVFPSKLAGIVQIQGRGAQLGISFGQSPRANCSGITPEQLERIRFDALDLSELTKDMRDRMSIPGNAQSPYANQAHIERLNQEGRAHD